MPRHLILLLIIVALAACAPTPPVVEEKERPATATAEALKAEGDWLGAALEYQRLAQATSGTARQDLLLRAAAAFIEAGDIDGANATLAQVVPSPTDQQRSMHQRLLQARIALTMGRSSDALALLSVPIPAQLSPELQAQVHLVRAQAYSMAGNYLEVARERTRLEAYLTDPVAIQSNQEMILDSLTVLTEQALLKLRVHPPPDVMSGWMELAYIAKANATDPVALRTEIIGWQQRYPVHPASSQLLEQLIAERPQQPLRPQSVALLLPLQGKFAAAARAVRDGFIAAYYADVENTVPPRVRVYDVTNSDIWSTYQRAVAEGAEFVVGPLSKAGVGAIAGNETLEVPVLALNYISNRANLPDRFYQFGLSPEGEADQVAERIWLDGHSQGIALVPEGAWGDRILHAFSERWGQLGGTLADVESYQPKDKDFSESIRRLLQVEDSEARYKQLRATLDAKIEFEPRRRQDADFIFLAAFPRHARQLQPGLKFYGATDLPVYSTSHVFSGTPQPSSDRDLDGIVFGDMPWVLQTSAAFDALHQTLTKQWPAPMAAYPRLYALGIDAYRVIPYLQELSDYHYAQLTGVSGTLHLDQYNRLLREITWARFREGLPEAPTEKPAI